MVCYFFISSILIFLFYAAKWNYSVLHSYRLKIADCFVLKDNLPRKVLVGTLRNLLSSLVFSLLLSWVLIEIYANFDFGNLIFYSTSLVLTIYLYNFVRKKYGREITPEVLDYLGVKWLPLVVAFFTSLLYSVYLINTISLGVFTRSFPKRLR